MTTEPSVGELLGALARDTGLLVKQEVRLASNELSTKTSKATHAIGVVAAGGALVHAGLLALVAALVIGLAAVIPPWVSALIMGMALVGVGYALLRAGIESLRELDPVPHQTVTTLKEDAAWAKEQAQ